MVKPVIIIKQEVLCLVVVCMLAGSHAQPSTSPLAASMVIADLKAEITNCNGQFICRVNQLSSSFDVKCINADHVCNGVDNCENGVDEHDCPRMCEEMVLCPDKKTCALPCDGVSTCAKGEDELGCPPKCAKPEMLCNDYKTCAKACDGDPQCPDNADENMCGETCANGKIPCADGRTCATPCDRIDECANGADEMNCPFQCRCTKGQYICRIKNKCVERDDVCEKNADTAATSCLDTNVRRGDDEDSGSNGTKCQGS